MNKKKYLADRMRLIAFYFILMFFMLSMVYLDRKNRMINSNIGYMFGVSIILFLIYLIADYYRQKEYYEGINRILEGQGRNLINNLPEPKNYEQDTYNKIIEKLYYQTSLEIDDFKKKDKEDMEFITAWVHQVKTPIAVSRLIIENGVNTSHDIEFEKILYSIEEEIDKIEDYVQKSLYYSRAGEFSEDYIISNVDPVAVIKKSIKKHSKYFINKSIKVNIGQMEHEISTDSKSLGFIIDQIISNAVKYTDVGGEVTIYMEYGKNETMIHFEDNGIGIKEEDLKRLFNKSFTGYNGREVSSSTGMGLYLSQKLANKLGHYLTITSKYGFGTKATIHFPKWTDYFDVVKNKNR